jgi:hypothetical protein
MANWTQQITEAYRALQEAELLKGRAAAAKPKRTAAPMNHNSARQPPTSGY